MMRNSLRSVRSVISQATRGGRSVVSRRNFSSPPPGAGANTIGGLFYLRAAAKVAGAYVIGVLIGQKLRESGTTGNSPAMALADASPPPRLSLDSSSLNQLPREDINNFVLAIVEMENKREELENKRAELENAHNSTREELNQMKKTMKANFPGLFERKLSVGISPGMPMAKVDASSD